jgi:hypothetical protein
MAGGLLNLVAEGANNTIIQGGDNQKTLFRATYNKITNFGLQKFRIDYDGLRDLRLSEASVFSFKMPRYAELLMDTYISITLPHIWSPIYHPTQDDNGNWSNWSAYDFRWIKNIGTNLIKEIEIKCGNFTLQKYSGDYLAAMVERDFDESKKKLFYEMTGNVSEINDPANSYGRANTYPSSYYTTSTLGSEPSIRGRTLLIPINAWFTLDSKCAFPMASLQYNELYVNVTLRPIEELFQVRDVFDSINNYPYVRPDFTQDRFQLYRFLQTPPSEVISKANYPSIINGWNADIHILANYCFLSKEETRVFTSENQVYLIKDIIEHTYENVTGSKKIKVQSNGMVANWMWYLQRNDVYMRNEWSNYTNWPYRTIPGDIQNAPITGTNPNISLANNPDTLIGPLIQPTGKNTGYFITGDFTVENQKDILETMGILFNGEYRENLLTREVYDYIEKYTRTKGFASNGIYCYNFCLNTSPTEYQPTGAINMSKFKTVEIELNTFVPQFDLQNYNYQIICNEGVVIATNSPTWRLYEYNYTMRLFEERYNVLSFVGGYCGLLYAK